MKRKILIVDDDSSILQGMKLVLEFSGFEVNTTTRGEETYDKALLYKPDLIILDVMLIGMDGREIAQVLKAEHQTKHIPIIIMSASNDVEETIDSYGVNDFMPKPFDMDKLVATIEKHIK